MRLAAKNQCTSFYFLLQRKCFCHIVLHPWFEGTSSTKSSRLFLVPFTRAFPVSTSTASHPRPTIPFLSLNSCPSDCWAGQRAQHCVGNKVCSDRCSTHSTAPVSKRVEKRGLRHTNRCEIANDGWHHQHWPQCPFTGLGSISWDF